MINPVITHQTIAAVDDWEQLRQAHHLIRQARISEAMQGYRYLHERRLERYFAHGTEPWVLIDEPQYPSMTWACIYLCEFYIMQRGRWLEWADLAGDVLQHADFGSLPLQARSRLVSTKGWADVHLTGSDIQRNAELQVRMLAELESQERLVFEQMLHHRLLGYLYQQLRQPDKAFFHLDCASALVDAKTEPFYSLRVKEIRATTLYYFKDFDSNYNTQAIDIYLKILEIAEALDEPLEMSRQAYNLGWAYAEQPNFEKASLYFRRGLHTARKSNFDYERALNLYGEGFLCLSERYFDESIELLQEASAVFDELEAPLMTAMCLQLEAAVLQRSGKIDVAVDCALRALASQRMVDNPIQLYHTLRRIVKLCTKRKDWATCGRYFPEYFCLKIRLKK
ncbi:MAG: hypothetical protein HY862_13845 [Chloroflexi bacterium]|nr:hypothetical protein [Chloroflexota bacterium]